MKILITGGNGFIAQYLGKYYREYGHHITAPSKLELDLTDEQKTREFFAGQTFDLVIHAALYGRELINTDDSLMYTANMKMFENLIANRHRYTKLVNFGSGYEYDISRNIDNADEDDIMYVEPTNPYGLVKNHISRKIRDLDNHYTLRLFGIIHYTEPLNRFFNKLRLASKNPNAEFHISEDKRTDYFNLEDLPMVIDLIINNKIKHKEINCVYENKLFLSEHAKLFCEIKNIDSSFIQVDGESDKWYTGDNSKLASYNLPLLGLQFAMFRY